MEDKELIHYGVLGMKWGVRKARKSSNPSDDSKTASKLKTKTLDEMSNNELRTLNTRLQLEQQYKQLTKKKSKGKQAVNTFIKGASTAAGVVAAYATYKKLASKALEKASDLVVKGIDLSMNI